MRTHWSVMLKICYFSCSRRWRDGWPCFLFTSPRLWTLTLALLSLPIWNLCCALWNKILSQCSVLYSTLSDIVRAIMYMCEILGINVFILLWLCIYSYFETPSTTTHDIYFIVYYCNINLGNIMMIIMLK